MAAAGSITLSPSQFAALLEIAIPAREPVLVAAGPGVGKSSIVEDVVEKLGYDLLISHPVVSDPTDAKGLPWADGEGGATFLPFGDLKKALESTKPLVWFLDDLGQASPAVQASFMQLLLARRVNGHVLPDHVTFVAATNRRSDKAGVSGILEPVKSRFGTIVELHPTVDDWTKWAVQNEIPAEFIAFMRLRGDDLLFDFNPSNDLTQSPLPRTWAKAAKLWSLDLPEDLQLPVLSGAVGHGAASEFLGFVRFWKSLPSLDAILLDPSAAPLPDKPDVLYAVATALGSRINEQTIGSIAVYLNRLVDAGNAEFAILAIRDGLRRDPSVAQTADFINSVAGGTIGELLSGEHQKAA